MPQPVQRVERKRRRQDSLRSNLDRSRQLLGLLHDLLRAERLGCDEVCECEAVEENRETDAGDTVGNRTDPGQLGLVDGEMRG